jgi:tetratricopeptide (TPR) repeat protein
MPRILVVPVVCLFSCLAIAQSQTKAPLKPVKATSAAAEARVPAKPKLTDDQKLALNILESSEAASRGLEAPMRSYALLQIASSFPTPDEKRSRALLHDAFTASLQIQDDDATKSRLQEDILRAMLPLSLEDVQELLPQAELKVRKQISENIIGLYTDKKEFEKAIDLVDQVTAWDEFPYRSGGKLMDTLPADMMAEKQGLFLQAVNSYKNHKHSGLQVGGSLTDIIVRHSGAVAPQVVLSAIDDVLSQARSQDEENHGYNLTIGGSGGSVSFEGNYQYQLFALLPILERLDEGRAKSLLNENQALQAKLQQYPLGIESVMPAPKEPPKSADTGGNKQGPPANAHFERSINSTDQKNTAMAAQMQAAEQARQQMKQVMDEAENDPVQALAHATTLPIVIADWTYSPRGNALAAIAQANVKKNTSVASQALSELRKIVPDMPLAGQAQALQSAANAYLKMGNTESAEKAVSEGLKVADKLLEKDLDPEDPNQALKAWWPSADAYRKFVEVQTKISPRETLNLLKEIKDPEIRAVQSVMYARALLGLPMKQATIVEKRKHMNRTSVMSTD